MVDDGPRRWTVDILKSVKYQDDGLPTRRLINARKESNSLQIAGKLYPVETLTCVYSPPPGAEAVFANPLQFWLGKRPDFPAQDFDPKKFWPWLDLSGDVGVNRCPDTWGEAQIIAWGPSAWNDYNVKAGKLKAAQAATEQASVAAQALQAKTEKESWIAAARAAGPLSAADYKSLLSRAEAKIASFEGLGRDARWQAFRTEINEGFGVDLVRLTQSAWLQGESINAAGAGRKRFDVWDNDVAGPVIHLIRRVENYRFSQEHRRMTFAEIQQGDAAIRAQSNWRVAMNMAPMLNSQDYLMSLMAQKLQGQHLIRPEFLARAAKDIERDRPTGDPGRALYVYKPTEQREDWSLTPLEQAVGKATDIAGLLGTMLRTFDKVDSDARESRTALWKCIKENCNEAGSKLYAYSVAQTAKDHFFFLRGYTSMRALQPLMSVMGSSNIDGGIVPGCRQEVTALHDALSAAAERRGNSTNWVGAVLEGPVYKDWKTCRDKMEYFLRPRNP